MGGLNWEIQKDLIKSKEGGGVIMVGEVRDAMAFNADMFVLTAIVNEESIQWVVKVFAFINLQLQH